jgi:flagellar protein FlaH
LVEVPEEDGFGFELEQDSLADCMGLKLPSRSLMVITGEVGGGKSLISQRMTFGLLENGAKLVYITNELTTRGWIEQMHSIGYWVTDYIKSGKLLVISSYGTVADEVENVGVEDLLESEGLKVADVIIIDSLSQLSQNEDINDMLSKLRKFCSKGHTIILTCDPEQMDSSFVQQLRATSEIALDLKAEIIGGAMSRTIVVTRYLRAAGPLQSTIGWRVEPGMGFIVDITAVS